MFLILCLMLAVFFAILVLAIYLARFYRRKPVTKYRYEQEIQEEIDRKSPPP